MGYILEAKINTARVDEFLEFIKILFIGKATVFESFSNRYVFNVSRDCIKSLAHVFSKLEQGNSFIHSILFDVIIYVTNTKKIYFYFFYFFFSKIGKNHYRVQF
jgi:hypothetical protein